MSRFFTLSFIFNSYNPFKKKTKKIQSDVFDRDDFLELLDENGFEPSEQSIEAIMNFAKQYEAYESQLVGTIELSLN